jgi:hypothetical protein
LYYSVIKEKITQTRNIKSLIKQSFKRFIYPKLTTCRPFGLNGADYVGTLSQYYSDKLIERGLLPRQLRPVGLPRFDEIIEYRRRRILQMNELKKESDNLVILLPQAWGFEFGNPPNQITSVESEISRAKIIFKALAGKADVKYRIRAEERSDRYRNILEGITIPIIIEEAQKVPPYKSILKSDLVITTGSTMLLEALALGKLGILFDASRRDCFGYARDGGCLMAYDDQSLVLAIMKILQSTELQKEMRQKANKYVLERAMIDGKASERTCQFIEDIVSMH